MDEGCHLGADLALLAGHVDACLLREEIIGESSPT
jgi:hypothetical protein